MLVLIIIDTRYNINTSVDDTIDTKIDISISFSINIITVSSSVFSFFLLVIVNSVFQT